MKKSLSIILIFVLLCLVGCEEKKDNNSSEEQSQATTQDSFAVNDKVSYFYHDENASDITQKEYANLEEVLKELQLEVAIDAPAYAYYDVSGDVCMSLYYDEKQGVGLVWFDPSVYVSDDAKCYVFYASEIEEYMEPEAIWPYDTDNDNQAYLEPIVDHDKFEVSTYHNNTPSPSYTVVAQKGGTKVDVARLDYIYYDDTESEFKCVKFKGEQAVFGSTANTFEIWYDNNKKNLNIHTGVVVGDVKFQVYNIGDKVKYEFYGALNELPISINILEDVILVTGLK